MALVYDGDWVIFIGDQLTPDFHLHLLVFGDGTRVAWTGWSALKSLYANPEAAYPNYITTQHPFVAAIPGDAYLLTMAERYAGNWPYDKTVVSRSVKDSVAYDGHFTDPAPFTSGGAGFDGVYGLALAVNPAGTRVYAVRPDAVFFAPLASTSLDLSSLLRGAVYGTNGIDGGQNKITLELTNDNHALDPANVGTGSLAVLARGNDLSLSLGYTTSAGNEVSPLGSHTIDSFGWRRDKVNLSLFTIIARDGWEALRRWRSRYSMRFNDTPGTTPLYLILAAVLARVGYRLRIRSNSALATGFYPQVTVNPGARGDTVVKRLLEMMPDRIYFAGYEAWMVNPLAADAAVYAYYAQPTVNGHPYDKGVFVQGSPEFTQMHLSGKDLAGGPHYSEGVDWTTFASVGSRLVYEHDVALRNATDLTNRFNAAVRQEVVEAEAGELTGQPNVGQELWDVVSVTDSVLGMSAVRRRVAGITMTYAPEEGKYGQCLWLSGV